MAILIYTFIASLVAFIIYGWDKRRQHYGLAPLPTPLLVTLGVLAPFGALMGMLLFCNRLKETLFIILIPLLLIAYTLGVYLLRAHLA